MVINFVKPKITFYDKCENMPLWNFQKYLETNDLRYFTKEFKEHKDLNDIMINFFGEYLELTKNQTVINRFELMHKIMRLQSKYNTVSLILKALYNYPTFCKIEKFTELVKELEKWNYRIDRSKDIFTQLEKISNRLQGILTQIELLEDQIKPEGEKESKSIESQILSVTRALDLRYQINSKEITVSQWVELCNQADETIKSKQKQQRK